MSLTMAEDDGFTPFSMEDMGFDADYVPTEPDDEEHEEQQQEVLDSGGDTGVRFAVNDVVLEAFTDDQGMEESPPPTPPYLRMPSESSITDEEAEEKRKEEEEMFFIEQEAARIRAEERARYVAAQCTTLRMRYIEPWNKGNLNNFFGSRDKDVILEDRMLGSYSDLQVEVAKLHPNSKHLFVCQYIDGTIIR